MCVFKKGGGSCHQQSRSTIQRSALSIFSENSYIDEDVT